MLGSKLRTLMGVPRVISLSIVLIVVHALVFSDTSAQLASGQVVVFLPEYSQFRVNSSFFVPDGGSVYQGGVSRMGMGARSSGVPLLGNVPGLGRLGGNRGIGYSSGASGVVTTARVYNMREIGEGILKGTHDRYGNLIANPVRSSSLSAAPSLSSNGPMRQTDTRDLSRQSPRTQVFPGGSSRVPSVRTPAGIQQRAKFLKANLGRNR